MYLDFLIIPAYDGFFNNSVFGLLSTSLIVAATSSHRSLAFSYLECMEMHCHVTFKVGILQYTVSGIVGQVCNKSTSLAGKCLLHYHVCKMRQLLYDYPANNNNISRGVGVEALHVIHAPSNTNFPPRI